MKRRSFLSTAVIPLSAAFSIFNTPFRALGIAGETRRVRPQAPAPSSSAGSRRFESENFVFQPLADGVYCAVSRMGGPGGSNAAIVINEEWVLVVDAHIRPSAAREVIGGIARITPLPVRFVVNTHFHNDHTQGNQSYFGTFPKGVEYISHVNTRRDIVEKAIPRVREELARIPADIRNSKLQMEAARDDSEKLRLKAELDDIQSYLEELRGVNITLPTITFDSSLILPGPRPIELYNFGRGHTAGDVVVFLPDERVLVTGDLFLGPHIPYASDSYPSEWIAALKNTLQLDFDQVALGHTSVVRGEEARAQMQRLIAFMEDAVSHARDMVKAGKSLQAVIAAIDVSRYKDHFANWPTHGEPFIARAYAEAARKQ
jgi:cyclase